MMVKDSDPTPDPSPTREGSALRSSLGRGGNVRLRGSHGREGVCACGDVVFYLRRREGEQKNQLPTARTMTSSVTMKAQTLAAREVALMV